MSLFSIFSMIPDPRVERTKFYSVAQILVLSVPGYLCGHTGYRGTERFGNADPTLLSTITGPACIPGHVTIRDVLQRIDKDILTDAFQQWVNGFSSLSTHDERLSGDGKTLCSTVSNVHNENQDLEAVVSLFGHKSGPVKAVGHYKDKSKDPGEQDVLRFLVEQLKGMGAVITLDALHAQKKQWAP